MRRIPYLFFLFVGFFVSNGSFAQSLSEVFGKNKIQYRKFEWKILETEDFRIYYYDRAGRDLARFVAEQVDKDLQIINKEAGTLFQKQLNIFVYNTYDELQQSNVGYQVDHEMSQLNPAGNINISGDKLTLYYSGNHEHLKYQMRKGMAKIYLEHLIFGNDFKSLMSNALQYDLPFWMTEGYVEYIVTEWTSKEESKWRSFVKTQQWEEAKAYQIFNHLVWKDPILAGKMFWKYLFDHYHEEQSKNFLLSVQSRNNIQKSSKEVLDTAFRPLLQEIIVNNYQRLQLLPSDIEERRNRSLLLEIPKKKSEDEVRSLKVSPRGGDVAYIKWNQGSFEVVVQKVDAKNKDESPSVILRGGAKNHTDLGDPDYPLIAWSNNGFKLGIVYEKNNRIRIRIYDAIKAQIQNYTIPASRFDRITGFTFMEDDQQMLFSAIKRGQSDLYEMTLKGFRIKQLTDDEWDDRSPIYVSGGARRGIVFLSNRTQPILNIKPLPNELPSGQFQAYFYNTTTQSNDLLALTNEQEGTIDQIIPYGSDHFAFLSDKSGINNRYLVYFNRNEWNQDTAYSVPHTFYTSNVIAHNYNAASASIAEIVEEDQFFKIYYDSIDYPDSNLERTWIDAAAEGHVHKLQFGPHYFEKPFQFLDAQFQSFRSLNHLIHAGEDYITSYNLYPDKKIELMEVEEDSLLDTSSYDDLPSFGEHFYIEDSIFSPSEKNTIYVDSTYFKIRPFQYLLNFKMVEIGVKLDYTNMFSRYQSYSQQAGQYIMPSLSGMMFFQLYDQLEDYRFNGGFKLGSNLQDFTAMLEFEQFKRRLDWSVQVMRQQSNQSYNFIIDPSVPAILIPGKQVSNFLKGGVKYPFSRTESAQIELGVRSDQMMIKAAHPLGLYLPNVQDLFLISRLELIHDNTINPVLNIWNGMRFKVYGDYYHKFYTNNEFYHLDNQSEAPNLGGMANVGIDFRFYQKIYRNTIAAFKFNAASSFGDYQLMYQMGGVEQQMNGNPSRSLPPSGKNHYAFQTMVGPLRGYNLNSRNGNTFALVNAELRIPLISTFTNWHVQSSFLKNFQIVGFLDVGSAWEGLLPTTQNMSRNYYYRWPQGTNKPAVVVYLPNTNDNGLAMGYGGGIRAQLLGYYFKIDAARNLRKEWALHLSLGTDF